MFRTSVTRWVSPPYEIVPLDPAEPDPLNRSRRLCNTVALLHRRRRRRRRTLVLNTTLRGRRQWKEEECVVVDPSTAAVITRYITTVHYTVIYIIL